VQPNSVNGSGPVYCPHVRSIKNGTPAPPVGLAYRLSVQLGPQGPARRKIGFRNMGSAGAVPGNNAGRVKDVSMWAASSGVGLEIEMPDGVAIFIVDGVLDRRAVFSGSRVDGIRGLPGQRLPINSRGVAAYRLSAFVERNLVRATVVDQNRRGPRQHIVRVEVGSCEVVGDRGAVVVADLGHDGCRMVRLSEFGAGGAFGGVDPLGTVPTIPLLRRLARARALDADLTINLTPHGNAA
jgi:hypothetical protein